MKQQATPALGTNSLVSFQKGRLWKVADLHLLITSVGKSMVHYRRYKMKPTGIPTTVSSKREFQKYLAESKAVLMGASR